MKPAVLCFTSDPALVTTDAYRHADVNICNVCNREQAFQALAARDFEAVATDFQNDPASGENGDGDFLEAVMHRYPQSTRIFLFDPTRKKPRPSADGVIHQCLTVPTSSEVLWSAAQCARFVSRLLAEPGLKQLFPQFKKLPSVPSVYFRVVHLLEDPNSDLNDIGKAVSEDFIMSAKLLQVVNSAYFGLPATIAAPAEAVAILGLNRFKALVLAAHVFSAFTPDAQCGFSVDKLWRHSIGVANLARAITQYECGDRAMGEVAYTAGLLHDVGKFILAANCPGDYNKVWELALAKKIAFHAAEKTLLGTTHAQIGAAILGTWGLPGEMIEAIAFHHDPLNAPAKKFSVLTAVHAANALQQLTQASASPVKAITWDTEYLENLGLAHRLDTWRNLPLGVENRGV
jgi:putative nucleotidyltransferase with HDIG domain